LTAEGIWYLCLYATAGTDLRHSVRSGSSREALARQIAAVWSVRADRGAEDRLREDHRAPLLPAAELRRDPHLEMHTRGG
jgi:GTP 3',8-cyclase